MDDTVDALIANCRENCRVCPQPTLWNKLWQMLPERRRFGAGWEPPLPLILGAWHHATNLQKMVRMDEHICWAFEHGALAEASAFLRALADADWHHLGD